MGKNLKIGLISETFRDGDIQYNVQQIKKRLIACSEQDFDLICFGEAFLQGFEALSWEYEEDLKRSLAQNHAIIQSLQDLAKKYKIALSFGYFEQAQGSIYCSYMVVSDAGKIIDNYRRVSRGWKESIADSNFYQEGSGFSLFTYKGKTFTTAICGDLWDDANLASLQQLQVDCVLWPNYLDFSIDKWEREEKEEYILRVKDIQAPVLMINSYVEDEKRAKGGCFVFKDNTILQELPLGKLGVLSYEM